MVAIIKQVMNAINPKINVVVLNWIAVMNCPMTIPVKVSLPTSYRALANSLRWVLSNVIFKSDMAIY